ncbi:nicotinate-nicotinamide nucleotide adenylyltransferase [Vibrio hannami]|uniref:nicotinate-nicotinamide nucleotide adenylyltransferase n=1 Tax=Vibrio hannami TaxID=2717094 RepID=UPI00240F06C6|nr:nicotinate-nicotinamide nucleotide adenylyltransferase [Vibrio hannami]MDG3085236.1 nicotinate-nicotinamide nucleotide adenylyltransferase [Vibrio hannami]
MTKTTTSQEKIAVFGSAFNPPSAGHQSVIELLTHFDKILLIPSIAHAWGKEMLCYKHRCELVDCFIADLKLDGVERSRVEEQIHSPGDSVTTFAVLQQLEKENPNSELTFVIGPDNFFNFSKFYKADEIVQRWSVVACPEKVKIRSTDIRVKIQAGEDVSELTTPGVAAYLKSNALYT